MKKDLMMVGVFHWPTILLWEQRAETFHQQPLDFQLRGGQTAQADSVSAKLLFSFSPIILYKL